MKNEMISKYFETIYYLQIVVGGIPERIQLGTMFRTFLLNSAWPVAFWAMWLPLFTITTLKLAQFVGRRAWHDVLDLMHMYLLGVNTHYFGFAVQRSARSFKVCTDRIRARFAACDQLTWRDFATWIALVCLMALAICVFLAASVFHGEVPVPAYIPFLDNDRALPAWATALLWSYQLVTAAFILWIYGFLTPFVVVVTTVLVHEIGALIELAERFVYSGSGGGATADLGVLDLDPVSCSDEDTRRFVRGFVEHHRVIISVIDEVKKIHNYFFLTQVLFTITHSCFLVFHIYYTDNPTKAVVKSSPFLVVSYYLLFIYCWNGQRLTDKCEELHHALYRGRWYDAPKSYKSSLLIILQYCQRPVKLAGGGVFTASLKTFLTGVEQSISYVLILKTLTRKGENN